jgi:putative ABC transport system permease protein
MSLAALRLAARALRRRPGYTALAVLILAVGIGANTAMFSVLDAVLWRSLPYARPEELVVLFSDGTARGQNARTGTPAADFLAWREQADAFAGMAALRNESRRITSLEAPVVPLTHAVTANYFDVLGARAMLGRTFVAGEDEPGRNDVVIVSHALWQSAFGEDRGLVGRTITLDNQPHTVVGVMPREFHTAHFIAVQPGIWVPTPISTLREDRTARDLLVYARLAPGRTARDAAAVMSEVGARLARAFPATNDRWGVTLVPLREYAVGQFRATGGVLLAAVALVLLIACANVANLTLVRGAERAREVAVRTALGARRGAIVRQLLTESLLVSLAGGALGALLARFGAAPLAALIPAQANVPFLDRVAVDGRVLLFALLVSVVSGVLFGLVPARHATRLDLTGALREGGRGRIGTSGRRLREAFVAAEVGLAVVVVCAAGLMLRTFAGLQQVPPGFDADRVLKLRTGVRGEDYRSPASRIAHFDELKRRLAAIPGIASVSAVAFEPPTVAGAFGAARLALPHAPEDGAAAPSAIPRAVLPDYFETMGIPVRQGRGITADDKAGGRRVAVISDSMARRYFAGLDPLGRTFALHGPTPQPMEIVGVVGDVITSGTDPAPIPHFYVPYAQQALPVMSVVMRVPQGDPMALARAAERVAWSLTPHSNVYAIETLQARIRDLNWRTRFATLLLAGFAALALALGAAGIYAVVSYTVLQRRTEIGLRMALGARASDVAALVLRDGLRPAVMGVVAGGVASALLTRVLSGALYGVTPGDPVTLGAVAAVLLATATAACLAPAWRGARVDPQSALRE